MMSQNSEKLYLSPTAALVMKWASGLYCDGIAAEFLKTLDLSSADSLINMCNKICPWYGEVIMNRKVFIKKIVTERITAYPDSQIVYLAAGLSPLVMEVLAENPTVVSRVFEIDIHSMDKKKNIYERLIPDLSKKINCYHADIASGIFVNLLDKDSDFSKDQPTIVIMEGISYYLSRQEMEKILSDFVSTDRKNFIIIEYLLPDESVSPEKRYIAQQVFRLIKEFSGLRDIVKYTGGDLKNLFIARNGGLTGHYSMKEMEYARRGENKFFNSANSWWIECVTGIL
ncbi:MAG TPA: class I SAM-dependent methyltransferase [Candidatus Omnitrophota bacterium]|nr:class I SAM-dependent methyltransferase [Candidatus Omnitrophota bacterium]HPS19765.1 class I SAM-dependent methyltransferase [Candidatus Omnitrophota bacterium]